MAICRRWQRAPEPSTGQATVVVVTNAAAQQLQRCGVVGRRRWWPTALDGAPSALERAAWPPPAAAVRRAASAHRVLYWHTRRLNWPNARLPLTGAAPVAAQVAGVRARLATAERSRARPRGAPAPAGVRVLAPRVSTPLRTAAESREGDPETSRPRLGSRPAPRLGEPLQIAR